MSDLKEYERTRAKEIAGKDMSNALGIGITAGAGAAGLGIYNLIKSLNKTDLDRSIMSNRELKRLYGKSIPLDEYMAMKIGEIGEKELKHADEISNARKALIKYRPKIGSPDGAEMKGAISGDKFVKEWKGQLSELINDEDKMVRVVNETSMGPITPKTHFYEKGGVPKYIVQDIATPMDDFNVHKFTVDDRVRAGEGLLDYLKKHKGVLNADMNHSNFAYDKNKIPRIIDLGLIQHGDIEKAFAGVDIPKNLVKRKINSKYNKKLLMEIAKNKGKKFAKIVPGVGMAISMYDLLSGNDSAFADVIDPTGVLSTSDAGDSNEKDIVERELMNMALKNKKKYEWE